MTTSKGRQFNYEAMFLLSQSASVDFGGSIEHVRTIITKAGANLIAMRKWDERRLAFEINKQKRGTYILAYFSCDPSKLSMIERDCNLSEQVMRSLVLRCDHLSIEEMQATDGQRELDTEAAMRRSRAEAPAPGASTAAAAPAEAEPAREPMETEAAEA